MAAENEAAEVKAPERQTEDEILAHTVKCFITEAHGMDPTDPVKALEAYFEKNASEGLKARVKADGKTMRGCWKFIEDVARRAHAGHIDPVAVYAMAMHYFEDIPVRARWEPSAKVKQAAAKAEDGKAADGDGKVEPAEQQAKPANVDRMARPIKPKKAKARKPRTVWSQDDLFAMGDIGARADAQDVRADAQSVGGDAQSVGGDTQDGGGDVQDGGGDVQDGGGDEQGAGADVQDGGGDVQDGGGDAE